VTGITNGQGRIINDQVKVFAGPPGEKFDVEPGEVIKKIRLINISGQVITDIMGE